MDRMMGEKIKDLGLKIPVERVNQDSDRYLLGSKIVMAKIISGELYVRTGGVCITL